MPFYTGDLAELDALKRIETFVDKLAEFLDHMDVSDCVIVACSLSTPYALAMP